MARAPRHGAPGNVVSGAALRDQRQEGMVKEFTDGLTIGVLAFLAYITLCLINLYFFSG